MQIERLEITYLNQTLKIEYFLRKGEKQTLLYLHGLGCLKNDFIGAVTREELKDYTLVSFDFPGCGNSPYPENVNLGIDDLVEITKIMVFELSLNNLVIIGHSMGGLIGLLYIKRYGKDTKGFINVEGNLAPKDCMFSREVIEPSFREFKEEVFPNLKKKLFHSGNRGFKKYAETLEKYSSPKAFFDYSPSLVDYSDHGDLISLFNELKIFKLFIYGSENRWLPHIKKLRCKIIEIPLSNHFPFYDNPEEFYRAVSDFLEKI